MSRDRVLLCELASAELLRLVAALAELEGKPVAAELVGSEGG